MSLRHTLVALSALALGSFASAQSETTPAAATFPSPPAPTSPPTASGSPTAFATASLEVKTAVTDAQNLANAIRVAGTTVSAQSVTPGTGVTLPGAVSRASTAIVQESRIVRSDILAERQAALTRLRLAQTEADRRRLMDDLRVQASQRMEEQREVARLVRDRLRELRDTTSLSPRPSS